MIDACIFKEEAIASDSMALRKAKSGRGGRRPGAGRKPTLEDPVSLTGDIERADAEALSAIAAQRDVSVASLVRKAVSAFLKRQRRT